MGVDGFGSLDIVSGGGAGRRWMGGHGAVDLVGRSREWIRGGIERSRSGTIDLLDGAFGRRDGAGSGSGGEG